MLGLVPIVFFFVRCSYECDANSHDLQIQQLGICFRHIHDLPQVIMTVIANHVAAAVKHRAPN